MVWDSPKSRRMVFSIQQKVQEFQRRTGEKYCRRVIWIERNKRILVEQKGEGGGIVEKNVLLDLFLGFYFISFQGCPFVCRIVDWKPSIRQFFSKVCFVLIFILLQCLLSCVDFLSSDCSSELVLIKFLSYDYQVLPNFGNA